MRKKVSKSGNVGRNVDKQPRMLLSDVCRCQDEKCPQCDLCLRFIQRYSGRSRVETMRELGSDVCNYFIGK